MGQWDGVPVSIFASRLVKELSFQNRDEATRFAIGCAKPLKAEALQAARIVLGEDLKPFRNKGLRARVWDDIEFSPGSESRFILHIVLAPYEAWAVGEYGTADHLIGLPRSYPRGRSTGGSDRTAFGQLVNTAARVKRNQTARKKERPVYLRAPGYPHPVRGPIVVRGIPGRGLIRYAFKRVRTAQNKVVSYEWVKFVGKAVERAR